MNVQELKLECLKLAKEINGTNPSNKDVIKDAKVLYGFIEDGHSKK